MHAVTYETLMENQENQVHGYVHYTDAAGMSLQQLTLFTPREAIRIVKNGEVNFELKNTMFSNCKNILFIYTYLGV